MKTLQDQYKLIREGKGHKGVFLNEAKRMFPNYIPNSATFETAADVLKHKGIISENIVGIEPINSISRPKESYEEKFAKFLEEAKKKETGPDAEVKKTTKEVEDTQKKNFDRTDKKNPDNHIFGEIMKGYYCEMKDPKNADKTEQQLRDIVLKNLAKDPIYYTKNGMFGEKGVGVELEVPGLGSPKEPKGKYKSSGYGTLKEGIGKWGTRYSEDDFHKIVDYHERTGMLPKNINAKEFNQLKALYNPEPSGPFYDDREDFDPAGGSGLYSHLEEMVTSDYEERIDWVVNQYFEGNPKVKEAAIEWASIKGARMMGGRAATESLFREYWEDFGDEIGNQGLEVADMASDDAMFQESLNESHQPGDEVIYMGTKYTVVDEDEYVITLKDEKGNVITKNYNQFKQGEYKPSLQEQQLRKVIRESIEKELAAINKEAESEVLNLKLEKIQAAIEKRTGQLSKLDEDEDMKALTDKKKIKELEKDVKTLEKAKAKIEKQLAKVNKKKGAASTKKEVIDEDVIDEADINEAPATQDLEKGVESAEAIKKALDDASKIELEENYPEEGSAEYDEYMGAKEAAETRADAGEDIENIINDFPKFKDLLYQDLKGKFDGSDY